MPAWLIRIRDVKLNFLLLVMNVIIFICLSAFCIWQYKNIGPEKKLGQFNILLFGTNITLSSDYYLDPKKDSEIRLIGEKGRRILIGGKMQDEFLKFSINHATRQVAECGLTILSGTDGVAWVLIFNEKNFMYFVGDNSTDNSASIVGQFCQQKAFGEKIWGQF